MKVIFCDLVFCVVPLQFITSTFNLSTHKSVSWWPRQPLRWRGQENRVRVSMVKALVDPTHHSSFHFSPMFLLFFLNLFCKIFSMFIMINLWVLIFGYFENWNVECGILNDRNNWLSILMLVIGRQLSLNFFIVIFNVIILLCF